MHLPDSGGDSVAGHSRVREVAAWFAVSRAMALLGVSLLSLLVLATMAAFIVDAVEVTAPQLAFQDSAVKAIRISC
jgi:hypothetical protein